MKFIRSTNPSSFRIGNQLLNLILPSFFGGTAIGDYQEIFHRIAETEGRIRANRWYWSQIVRSLIPFIINSIQWRVIMLKNNLRIALRVIKNHRGFSFINIFGLSVGLAAFLIIFMYVGYELSFDRFHANHEQIYRLSTHMPGHYHSGKDRMAFSRLGTASALHKIFPEIKDYVRIRSGRRSKITLDGQSFFEAGIIYADHNFFNFFSFNLLSGEIADVLSAPYSMVISQEMSEKYFGTANPVGRVLRFNDETDMTIRGVMENMPKNTQFKSDFVVSLTTYGAMTNIDLDGWRGSAYSFIRLDNDIDPKSFENKIRPYTDEHMPSHGGSKSYFFLQKLGSIHLRTDIDAEMAAVTDARTLTIFGTVAVLILLVASINYMNLTTARSAMRMKEVGIRKVIGARKSQLRRQFLGETFFMTLLAFLLAIIIVTLALPPFNQFVDRAIPLQSLVTFPIGFWALAAFLGVSFLSGIYPALYLSRFQPGEVLQSRMLRVTRRFNLRAVLVILQFAVSIILLVCTLVVRGQLHFIQDYKVGYNKDQILVYSIGDNRVRDKLDIIKNDLAQMPNVQYASSTMHLPNSIRSSSNLEWPGKPEEVEIQVYTAFADYDYVDLFGLELVEGRNFSRNFPVDKEGAFLVNETAVRVAGWDQAIGKELTAFGDKKGKVVGILKDFHFHSLHRPVEPLQIYLESKQWIYYLTIKIDGQNIPENTKQIHSYLSQYPNNQPLEYEFFDDIFDRAYRNEMRFERIVTIFAALAILIAGLGLLGLASFMVARRKKEIGIRKVMGSSEGQMVWSLLRSFLQWVVIANALAWPFSWWIMRRWLADFSFQAPLRIELFILAGLSTLVIAAALICYQAIRAARANPVDALRYE